MLRYFYAWVPLVIVGPIALLALPWLALIALFVFAVAALSALAALAWAIVAAPLALGRAVGRRWRARGGVERPQGALSFAEQENAFLTIAEHRSGGPR